MTIPFFVFGCAPKTEEEVEAAKYSQPKMMSEEEGAKFMAGQSDPRKGGAVPPPPPNQPAPPSKG